MAAPSVRRGFQSSEGLKGARLQRSLGAFKREMEPLGFCG